MNKIITKFMALILAAILYPATISAHPGSGIAVDKYGQVYFLDTGSGLWKIDTLGRLSRISTVKFHWLAMDVNNEFSTVPLPSGAGTSSGWEILKVGSNPTVLLGSDWPIAVDNSGRLFYQSGQPGDLRITQASSSGDIKELLKLPLTSTGRLLPHVNGLALGPDGALYYTEDSAIRKIDKNLSVSTVANIKGLVVSTPIPGISREAGPLLRGLEIDSQGVIYVAAAGDGRVLKITPDGMITTLVQTQSPWSPTAVALSGGNVYVLEYLNTDRDVRRDWLPRVRKITTDGQSTIIATVDQMPGAR